MSKSKSLNEMELAKVRKELHLIFKEVDDLDEESKKEKRKRIGQLHELEDFYESNILFTIAGNMGLTDCYQLLGQFGLKISNPEGAIVLSPPGKSALVRMIREEKMKRYEQWVKIIGPIISSLIGLLGVIVALVALLVKR